MQNDSEAPAQAGAIASLPAADAAPGDRAPTGQFVAGKSGNPAGRAPGSKNFVTKERLALEGALREYMGHPERKAKIIKAIDRLIDLASNEHVEDKISVGALKVLLDKVMSSAKQDEDMTAKEAPEIRIIIENTTARPATAKIIDAEFTEEEPK